MGAFALIVFIVAILDSLPGRRAFFLGELPPVGGGDSSCNFLVCLMANPCQNQGNCSLNWKDCSAQCECPPPYDDPRLYDEQCRTRLGGGFPDPPTTSVTADPCSSGSVTCMLASPCQNGGTCVTSGADCAVTCRCPPPYDDPLLYDQHCLPRVREEPRQENETLCPTSVNLCQNGKCRGKNGTNGPSFSCICDPGWDGSLCQYPCNRTCSNGGRCHYLVDAKEAKCNCPYPWKGDSCELWPPDPPTGLSQAQKEALISGLILGTSALLVCAALFIYFTWRMRLVFALKIAYHFRDNEEDEKMKYDAFVSCVDKDHEFVYQLMVPKLEKEAKFSLVLQERDFQIGAPVADNIMEFLEKSRRFILVLSKEYLQNDWRRFEFQRAFIEMIRHKLKIIVIKVGDVADLRSDDPRVDASLRNILDSVVHYRYPGPEASQKSISTFWERVRLSMPKRDPAALEKQEENRKREEEEKRQSQEPEESTTGIETSMSLASFTKEQLSAKPDNNHLGLADDSGCESEVESLASASSVNVELKPKSPPVYVYCSGTDRVTRL